MAERGDKAIEGTAAWALLQALILELLDRGLIDTDAVLDLADDAAAAEEPPAPIAAGHNGHGTVARLIRDTAERIARVPR